ncbi:MAG: phosphoribosyltransferase [Patescibacteria group bacterium]|nr:phosphoribosyltransferase [Patescibacteria group bacterium]
MVKSLLAEKIPTKHLSKKVKKVYLSWQEFNRAVLKLSKTLKKNRQIKNIYGIPRGGLILAVSLSHRLNIPLVLSESEISPQTLVVDDIYYTGKTINSLFSRHNLQQAVFWFRNQETAVPKDFEIISVKTKHSSEWLIFPWETEKSAF